MRATAVVVEDEDDDKDADADEAPDEANVEEPAVVFRLLAVLFEDAVVMEEDGLDVLAPAPPPEALVVVDAAPALEGGVVSVAVHAEVEAGRGCNHKHS